MLKKMTKIFMVFLAFVLVSGCSSTKKAVKTQPGQTTTTVKKIETRFYSDDRQRVDQEMQGNFGYLSGTPVPDDRSKYKKTRRVYVLEVTKNVDEAVKVEDIHLEPYTPSSADPLPPVEELEAPEWTKPVVIPPLEGGPEESAAHIEEYVVQQGDTLQKISKKFYNSYSKWTKIYEANTDTLKDPNRIKPGVTIRIPVNQ